MEIELKLLLARRRLAGVLAQRIIRRHARGPARAALLHSIYYDTPQFDLYRAGIALRLRLEEGAWIQTLKGRGEAAGGLHQRQEFEWKLGRKALDFSALARTPFRSAFSESLRRRLRPVFTTAFRRTSRLLALGRRTRAELALDSGEIRAGGRREAIAEAEIELLRGDPRRLITLARQLGRVLHTRVGNASKAARGYALAAGKTAKPSLRTQRKASLAAGASR